MSGARGLTDETCRLKTAKYFLRPLHDTDLDVLFAHYGDPAVTEFLDIEPHGDIAKTQALLAWAKEIRSTGTGLRWRISDAKSGAFVGTCGFHRLVYKGGRRGEVGYDLDPVHRGRGVMGEVLPVILQFGFGALNLHRIEAMITPGNERSCALLERHGFVREGVLRDFRYFKGRFWDQILYARLAPET